MNKVLITGEHPIKDDIIRRFRELGREVLENPAADVDADAEANEIVILTSPDEGDPLCADCRAMTVLSGLKRDGAKKKTVHLMLQSTLSLAAARHGDFADDIRKSFDVYPFCMADEWARKIVMEMARPVQPIDIKSNCRQHLVIFGMDEAAIQIAVNAALTFHYPNYTRDHRLRSRITFISPDAADRARQFIHRYEHLFRHSFYRTIDAAKDNVAVSLHRPENLPGQEDYVDIEWEFVTGDSHNEAVRDKLALWASSRQLQNLIIAIASDDDVKNLYAATSLPEVIYENNIPVYVRQRYDGPAECAALTGRYKSLHFYGMESRGYDVTLPLVRMGKIVNEVYSQCFNDNFGQNVERSELYNATEINPVRADDAWGCLSPEKRCSNLFNAMTVAVKLHSVGIPEDEWDKCYDLPESVIQMLAEVEHNRWNVEELLLGFRPCTRAEQDAVESDIDRKEEYKKRYVHFDVRPYKDLSADRTGRNVNVYDVVLTRSLPLIACEYMKEGGSR